MTIETVERINEILKKETHNYAAGFYTCITMDALINGTFGATKALVECGKISTEYEDELLFGYKGSSLRLFDIFNCEHSVLEKYTAIQHADKIFSDEKVPFSGATGYAIMLEECGVISDDELAYLFTVLAEEILHEILDKCFEEGGDMFEYDDE